MSLRGRGRRWDDGCGWGKVGGNGARAVGDGEGRFGSCGVSHVLVDERSRGLC